MVVAVVVAVVVVQPSQRCYCPPYSTFKSFAVGVLLNSFLVPVVVRQGRLQLALASQRKAKRDGMLLDLWAIGVSGLGDEGSCGLDFGFWLVQKRRARICRAERFYSLCMASPCHWL